MRRGFTLVELMVVLLVVALATHLAVRQLGNLQDTKQERAADLQLETIRDAALAFMADMGRPLIVTNGTLSELWQLPADSTVYRVVASEVVNPDGTKVEVRVPTGWRGPYLRLPIGKTRLFDPWGNAIETDDAFELPRIGITNEIYAASVSHYTAKATMNARREISLFPERGGESALTVRVISSDGMTELPDSITYKWFGPASGNVTSEVYTTTSSTEYAHFRGLTTGRRIVYDSVSRTAREVQIEPGDNLLEIRVP